MNFNDVRYAYGAGTSTSYSGTVTVDLSFNYGLDLEYGKQESITIPKELLDLEEEDLDDYMDFDIDDIMENITDMMSGTDTKAKAAGRKAESLISCMKNVCLEAQAQATDGVTVTVDFGNTKTSTPTLRVLDGTVDKTSTWGFSNADAYVDGLAATGTINLTLDISSYKWTYSVENLNIDGYTIAIDSYGRCTATK